MAEAGHHIDQDEVARVLRQVESYLREAERQLARQADPAASALSQAVRALALLTQHLAARCVANAARVAVAPLARRLPW